MNQPIKKLFSALILVGILTAVSVTSFAQGRNCRRSYDSRSYNSRTYYDNSRVYADSSRSYYDYGYSNRSVWDRHRDKLTVGAGTIGEAIIGGLIGGGRSQTLRLLYP